MYQVGELVLYGIHGVCHVVGIEERTVDRKKIQYLLLQPLQHSGSSFLVPLANPNAMAKLKPVLTRSEWEALLQDPQVREESWIVDESQRKQYYRTLIAAGDRVALLRMVRSLKIQREKQLATGRKFHLCDENFLRDALRLLGSEISVVLGIPTAEVEDYLQKALFE